MLWFPLHFLILTEGLLTRRKAESVRQTCELLLVDKHPAYLAARQDSNHPSHLMEGPFRKNFALFASLELVTTRIISSFRLSICFCNQSKNEIRMKNLGVSITELGYNAFKRWLRAPSDEFSRRRLLGFCRNGHE